MNIASKNLKLVIGVIYLLVLFAVLYFVFSLVDIKDLTNYEFIRSNKENIFQYKNDNLLLLSIIFFIFTIVWILLLGFAGPILLFAGFVYGKWVGTIIVLSATTIGATLLYILAGIFFRDLIRDKLEHRFSNLKIFFKKNELFYFMMYRFVGGGGVPYGIQNVLPVLFDISIKNYFIGTLVGSAPLMFVSVALGSGIESFIDKNEKLSILAIITSPDIYLPILALLIVIIFAFIFRKFIFKKS
tara:strand:+ start:954 stop:1682 length:729 start_codon:yes stop_codon:yes gene_type:complete